MYAQQIHLSKYEAAFKVYSMSSKKKSEYVVNIKPARRQNELKQHRIKAACAELELALKNFENDTEARENARRESQQIKEIRRQLLVIKRQLSELSD